MTWPCALKNLGFTLVNILGMRGSAREVFPTICCTWKKACTKLEIIIVVSITIREMIFIDKFTSN
jgi:hypothetical protein